MTQAGDNTPIRKILLYLQLDHFRATRKTETHIYIVWNIPFYEYHSSRVYRRKPKDNIETGLRERVCEMSRTTVIGKYFRTQQQPSRSYCLSYDNMHSQESLIETTTIS
jgi:hypothetical protein